MGRAPTKTLPDQARLLEIFAYNPDDGMLCWRVHQGSVMAGTIAGTLMKDGYRMVRVDRQFYLSHRLIWKMMTGCDPKEMVDHIDRDPTNNKWANLREARNGQNKINSRLNRNNRTGFRGVCFAKSHNKWRAVLRHNGRVIHVGHFSSKQQAALAREAVARELHGEFFISDLRA